MAHLAHANLAHELVLVSVHAGQLAHVCKCVLQAIGQLEGVNIAQAELDIGIHNQLCQSQDFSAQPTTTLTGKRLMCSNYCRYPGACTSPTASSMSVQECIDHSPGQGVGALYLHRWKALPKRDFLRSLVVSVFTGFRLKL